MIGGSGGYFDVADCVICMVEYKPYDVTQQSRAIAERYRAERLPEGGEHFGTHTIDLGAVKQLVDVSQTRAIGDAIYYATKHMDGRKTLKEIVDAVLKSVADKGLDVFSPRPVGDYAAFRGLELAAAMNRLRTLLVRRKG